MRATPLAVLLLFSLAVPCLDAADLPPDRTTAAAVTQGLLVRLELRISDLDGTTRIELYVYRDGHLLIRGKDEAAGGQPVLTVVRELATGGQVGTLNAALTANHVGLQIGGCFLDPGDPQITRLQIQVDWFGKAPRQTSFLADTKFLPECQPEVLGIVTAILEAAGDAPGLDFKIMPKLIEDVD